MWYMYTMEHYSAVKKNKITPFAATWTSLQIVIVSEVSQTEKEEYCITLFIKGIFKNMIQLFTKQKQTHRERIYG